MSRVKGNIDSMNRLRKAIAGLDVELARRTTKRCAGALNYMLRKNYAGGLTVYDTARPLGVKGNALTLVMSGDTLGSLAFVHDGGTRLRASLGTRYARYLIGKYDILPRLLPSRWAGVIRLNMQSEADRWARENGA